MCRFLLARLTFNALVGQITPKAIKRALNNLSRGSGSLDSAYDEAMKRIEDQHPARRDLAKRALLWITHGQRVLSVAEMQQAVAIELGESDIDPDSTFDGDDIISACIGLVTKDSDIQVLKNDRYGGPHRICRRDFLRLVHYTTEEYLDRNKTKYFPKAQQYLASSCLTYLLFDVFSGALCSLSDHFGDREGHEWLEAKGYLCFGCKPCWTAEQHDRESWKMNPYSDDICWVVRYKEYPFYAYAALYWGYHTENCDDEAIRILTERFLDDHKRVSGVLDFVRGDDNGYYRPLAIKLEDSNPGSAMQLAAFLGLTKTMSERLGNGSEPDVKDWSGTTPLFWAVSQDHEDVVRLLMTRGDVNPNVRGRYGRTPLMVAVENQNIAIVQRLLAYECIEINAKDDWGSSALMHAIHLGQDATQILKLLLVCDNIDVNLVDDRGQTPLMLAVEYGKKETVRLLLARGDIQANIRDNEGQTALYNATRSNWTEGMRLLLAQEDIQVNIRDNKGSTALHAAVELWEGKALQLFLARDDLEVNATDDRGESALFGAVRNTYVAAELFLVRGDVDVNIRNKYGQTPLHIALSFAHLKVVRLLLKREDLEISVEDGEGERLVSLAEELGEEERDEANEGRKSNANAIINLLRSCFQQRSSNTTSANLGQ